MALSIPTRKGVTDALRNYFRAEMPDVDTSTERRSLIGALVKSLGSALADFYITLKRWVDREPFPQTASESGTLFNGWWTALTHLERNPASAARGIVTITGTAGTAIPADMSLVAGAVTFKTRAPGTILATSLVASSLAVVDGMALFTTVAPHFLATGMTVTISGAAPSTYNGTYVITVTSATTFTYEPSALPGSTAGGSPYVSMTFLPIEVESTTKGLATNLDSGSVMTISSAPVGADGTARVTFGGIQGGAEIETADAYRARTLKALGTDYGMFTSDEIEIIAKQVPGVTKVMIRKASIDPPAGWPYEGQVKIAFLRAGDVDILPSAQEVADVKARIMALAMPAHTAEEDVIVLSPTPYVVNFAFASMVPNTPTMQRAVRATLTQFFRESPEWGEVVEELAYLCAIRDTVDIETNQRIRSFTLSAPMGPITPGVDDMPVLGTITFPIS
jgi:uncharacterized phage protein gp47/JayE